MVWFLTHETPQAHELSDFDVAAGFPLGEVPGDGDIAGPPLSALSSWAALEQALLPALQRPPAVVSFSGGRDSSIVLAAAISAARRNGLQLPVAVTLRYPGAPKTLETEWQELVVSHLQLGEWQVRDIGDDLDFVGDLATKGLQARGLRYPSNAHSAAPVLAYARGGTLVTGMGGDDVFAAWRNAPSGPAPGGHRLLGSRLRRTAMSRSPSRARRMVLSQRVARRLDQGTVLPWLAPQGRAALRSALARGADQPYDWPGFVAWTVRQRAVVVRLRTTAELAAAHGATFAAPLLDPAFLAAVARAGGRTGFASRTEAMQAVAGENLPSAVLAREDKALFDEVFFGPRTREFAHRWTGQGVNHELVKAEVLRSMWLSGKPDFRTALLLQQAWLTTLGA